MPSRASTRRCTSSSRTSSPRASRPRRAARSSGSSRAASRCHDALHAVGRVAADALDAALTGGRFDRGRVRAGARRALGPGRARRRSARPLSPLLLVCAGGALGSGARYLVSTWAARALGADFPRGTLIVNVSGSFLLALLMASPVHARRFPPEAQPLPRRGCPRRLHDLLVVQRRDARAPRARQVVHAARTSPSPCSAASARASRGSWRRARSRAEAPPRPLAPGTPSRSGGGDPLHGEVRSHAQGYPE